MSRTPPLKPQASRKEVIQALIDSGLWSNDKVTRMSVIGIRGYYQDTMGKIGVNDRGIYDDAVFVLSPTCFKSFNFNTDPSAYRRGRASLDSPQVVKYVAGYHGYGRSSGHNAFRQASDVVVHRDSKVGNGKPLGNGRFKDSSSKRFWINLHRGGRSTTSSAGCQTVPVKQWDHFYSLVLSEMKGYKQANFSYFLINGPIT